MYLSKVEITGFKSFGDPIKLDFSKGITAIIGPNGSGKSNVADAIRWVLGEQSARTLRGTKMEDIIFAGTEKRRPLGYAEVLMHIQNDTGDLRLGFSELVVKRRVYRSGESEYFLNGAPCRLRDIHETFMDTGVGREGYSIIGQGQIDKILSSKPEERRNVFEEAAGVYKFKVKRVEAERKLEKERENIARLDDILVDIETRLEPLSDEAEKTKLYLSLKEELRKVDINVYLEETKSLEQQIIKLNESINIVSNSINSSVASREQILQQENDIKIKRTQLQIDIETTLQQILDIEKSKEQQNSNITIYNERISTSKTLLAQLEIEMQKFEQQRFDIENEIKILSTKRVAFELEHKAKSESLGSLIEEFEALSTTYNLYKQQLEDINEDKYNKRRQMDNLKSDLKRNEMQIKDLKNRQTFAQDKIATYKTEIEQHQEEFANIDTEKERLSNLAKQQQVDLEKLKQYQNDYKQIYAQKEDLERKLNLLNQLKNDFDGYYKNVKQVLQLKNKGIRGIVADIIEVPKQYEVAITIALGGAMQNIVATTEQDAKNTILQMKQKGISRVTFLPQDTIKPSHELKDKEALSKQAGYIGIASNLVAYNKQDADIVSNLLGRTIIVDTIENASIIAKKFNYSYRLITLDGETFNVGGSLSGGSNKSVTNNVFSRARELKEAKQQLESLDKQLLQLKNADAIQQECVLLEQQKDNTHKQLVALESNEKLYTAKIDFIKTNQLHLIQEIEQLEQTQTEVLQNSTNKTTELITLEAEIEKIQSNTLELQAKTNEFDAIYEQYSGQITTQKLDIAKLEQSIENLVDTKKKLVIQLNEYTNLDFKDRKQQYLNDEKENLYLISQVTDAIASLSNDLDKVLVQKATLQSKQEELNEQEQPIRAELNGLDEKVGLLNQELIRLESKIESLTEEKNRLNQYIWEQYELTEGACAIYDSHMTSLVEMRKTQEQLKLDIRQIGHVNVNAVEEYNELLNKFTFLTDQKNDIQIAETSLLELIEKLTEEMHAIFREQFSQIAINFNTVFKELFGGGTAFLQLTDEENILEAGIDIIVRPPGKKMQNMNLLSGGERSLTAIALLFGILRLKPSPFCVLDEIEASLDDANVLRFAKYLESLSKDTQFIVITHRKGTMEYASTLYGVTQQEQGVSIVLSIELEDATNYIENIDETR
ncbi:MAG: chromosome segregation protein SMC [Epulopiscium sp. Nele67-Bin004]|nr:MAG: chromosome segregation protein SMC [Epulopiscium sp. Nele67-Bin004]